MSDFQLVFEAIGTKWIVDCFGSNISEMKILKIVESRVEEFDKTYSRFRKDSLIWKISKKKGKYKFPEDSDEFFSNYLKFYQVTDGMITLLIGNTLEEAGYDSEYNFKSGIIKKVPDISTVYEWNYPQLTVKKPYVLDFGALGKGYLIDIISDLLKRNGVSAFCVDAGGDIKCENLQKPLKIGLENPNNTKQAIGMIELNNKSICASAGNRRKWQEYHHIINPKTLESSRDVLATWVIAKNSIIADGLSTALFLVSPKKLLKYFDFEYLILYPDFKYKKSIRFSAELFIK